MKKIKNFPLVMGIYHIFLSVWAAAYTLQILVADISIFLFTIPMFIFIYCAGLGGYRLLTTRKKGINMLLVAQFMQALGFTIGGINYVLFAGQSVTLNITIGQFSGINFGLQLLNMVYGLRYGVIQNFDIVSINLFAIFMISLLLNYERDTDDENVDEEKVLDNFTAK